MAEVVPLNRKVSTRIRPKPPFNFDATVHKPSHFPTSDNYYQKGVYWQTIRFGDLLLGLKMKNLGKIDTPLIRATFYSEHPLANQQVSTLIREVRWRFDLDADLSLFCEKFMQDELLGPVLEKWGE